MRLVNGVNISELLRVPGRISNCQVPPVLGRHGTFQQLIPLPKQTAGFVERGRPRPFGLRHA
jgi:hypothetical protein